MAFNLDELDLIDDKQEKFVLSQEVNNDFNKSLQNSINQTEQIKSAYDLARETYEKDQINPVAAFIETYKPVRNEEKEARLKKTAAINSIGQALTNVIDAAYGKRGAYIPVRNNNSTAGILNTLAQEEGQYKQDLDKYNNLKLSQMIQELNFDKAKKEKDADYQRTRADKLNDYEIEKQDKYDWQKYNTDENIRQAKAVNDNYLDRIEAKAKVQKQEEDQAKLTPVKIPNSTRTANMTESEFYEVLAMIAKDKLKLSEEQTESLLSKTSANKKDPSLYPSSAIQATTLVNQYWPEYYTYMKYQGKEQFVPKSLEKQITKQAIDEVVREKYPSGNIEDFYRQPTKQTKPIVEEEINNVGLW